MRLAAVRRLAYEAADAGLLSPELAAGIRRVKGILIGKGGHVRTVPVPHWVKQFLDEWFTAARIISGKLFRCATSAASNVFAKP